MDKEQAITLAKKYKEMVAEKLPLKSLYLYGSYSKGNHREDSDIDIAVKQEYLSKQSFTIPLGITLKTRLIFMEFAHNAADT